MNKIAHYECFCGCKMAVCFVGMEPLGDVECQGCGNRAWISRRVEREDSISDPRVSIERLEQGFLMYVGGDKLGFSDASGVAGWLLDWLGFDEAMANIVLAVLAGERDLAFDREEAAELSE